MKDLLLSNMFSAVDKLKIKPFFKFSIDQQKDDATDYA